ncbi:MAG: hypothetical protein JNM80_11450 [Phycisphaerae bacterium]|nr:hypothetical protein [Phycisphaerae bacterium]
MDWSARAVELIWIGGLAALPVALLVALLSRRSWCRPATRHALWTAVLATLVGPLLTWPLGRFAWFRSERLMATADAILGGPWVPSTADTSTPPSPEAASDRKSHTPQAPPRRAEILPSLADRPALLSINPTESVSARPGAEHVDSAPTRPVLDAAAARSFTLGRSGPPESPATMSALTSPSRRPRPTSSPTPEAALADSPSAAPSPARSDGTVSSLASNRRTSPPVSSAASPASSLSGLPNALSRVPGLPRSTVPNPQTSDLAAASTQNVPATSADLAFQDVRVWTARALAVRDALAAVPPVPVEIWLAGVLVMAGLAGSRCIAARRLISNATPAPDEIQAVVARCAERAGLSRPPTTLVVDRRVSPMICCGLRPRLILPIVLWRDLDVPSRHAVVLHEMAHLRRLDHRLRWLESLVGVLYWWHPIVWWARRRLRDEAELCCDAWVTSLIPERRRAYAEALVATKSFLSIPGSSGAPGLAVMSSRTRHLARRLTMVMTQRVAPKSSILGVAVALGLALVGTLVMPSVACPPSEAAKAAEKASNERAIAARAAAQDAKKAATKARAAAETTTPADGAFLGEAPALEAMRRRAPEQVKIETERRAYEQAARAAAHGQRNAALAQERARAAAARALQAERRALDAVRQRTATTQGRAVASSAPGVRATTPPPGRAPAAGAPTTAWNLSTTSGATIARDYRLSPGKLEALTDLMARQDVPILIERHDDKIVVHASPAQHEVFAAFVRMIEPDGVKIETDDDGEEHSDALGVTSTLHGAIAALSTHNGALADNLHALRDHVHALTSAGQLAALQNLAVTVTGDDDEADDEARDDCSGDCTTHDCDANCSDSDCTGNCSDDDGDESADDWSDRLDDLTEQLDDLEEAASELAQQLQMLLERIEGLNAGRPRSELTTPAPAMTVVAPAITRPAQAAAVGTAAPVAPASPTARTAPAAPMTPAAPTAPVAPAAPAR